MKPVPREQAAEVTQRLRNPAAVVVQIPELQMEGTHQGEDALQVCGVAAAEADEQVHEEGVDARRNLPCAEQGGDGVEGGGIAPVILQARQKIRRNAAPPQLIKIGRREGPA